jgi:hypothetical protein
MARAKAVEGKTVKPIVPMKLVEQALAELPRPTRLEPMSCPSVGSEHEEIRRRIANFRAVQERMQREREDYFAKTLANTCQFPKGVPSER